MLTYRGNTSAGSTAGLTAALPAGWQPDDIFFLMVETNTGEAVTTPAGWTPLVAAMVATDTRLTTFWRRAVAGDTGPVIADAGNHISVSVFAFAGAITTGDPFTSLASTTLTTTAAFNFPAVTVPAAGHGILNIIGFGNDTTTDPIPTITQPGTDAETSVNSGILYTGGAGGGAKFFFALATASGAQQSSGSLANHKNVISLVLIPATDENAYVYNQQLATVEVTEPTTNTLIYNVQMLTITAPALNNPAPPNRRRGSMSFIP